MPENVIRQDIVEVKFDVDYSGLTKIGSEMNKLKSSVSGGVDKGVDKLTQGFNDLKKSADGLGAVKGINKLKNDIEAGGAAIDVAKNKFNAFKNTVKSVATHPIQALDKKVLSLQMSTGRAINQFKNLAKTKVDGLKTSLNNVKTTLTNGERGAKGFTNALKNIGKISVSKVVTGVEKLKSNLSKGSPLATKLRTGLKNVASTSLEKLKSGLSKVSAKLSDVASKAKGAAFTALKKLASISFKGIAVGIGACAAAIGGLAAKSVAAYGEYEQLIGGVQTLFGAKGAKSVEEYAKSVGKPVSEVKKKYEQLIATESEVVKNANNAYKSCGLSANAYMTTVTSFSASLIQSLGGDTQKAAAKADTALTDMSDNANKMGTSMESIQYAYQGFAKQNYTMLDNLKLGYGGTKKEMERLLADATKISGVKYDMSKFADITDAIHVIQTQMGITGTTAKEAATTIQGSVNSMKSAWANFLTGMADPKQDFDQLVGNLVDSVVTVGKNIVPRIAVLLPRLTDGLAQIVQALIAYVPQIFSTLLPALVSGATSVFNSFIQLLPQMAKAIVSVIPSAVQGVNQLAISLLKMLPQLITIGMQLITSLIQGIAQALPTLIPAIAKSCYEMVNAFLTQIPALISAGVQLIQGFIDGFISAIPVIIQQAPMVINNFVNAVTAALPMIIDAGISIINQLITGIVQNLPAIIGAALEMVNALTEGIITNLPVILNGAIELINALVGGLVDNLPLIIQAAQQLITGLCDGLITNLPTIIQAAIDLVLGLTNALIDNIGLLVNASIQLVIGIAQGLLNNLGILVQAAVEIIVALTVGLVQAIPTLLSVVPEVFGALWDAIKNINWLDLGKTIIKGVWEGVKSLGKSLWNGIKGLFSDDNGEAKTEGANTGKNYTNGLTSNIDSTTQGMKVSTDFANGIESGQGQVVTAAQGLSSQTQNAMSVAAQGSSKSAEEVAGTITKSFAALTAQLEKLPSQILGIIQPIDTVVNKLKELPVQFSTAFSALPDNIGSVKEAAKQFYEALKPIPQALAPVAPQVSALNAALSPAASSFDKIAKSAKALLTSLNGISAALVKIVGAFKRVAETPTLFSEALSCLSSKGTATLKKFEQVVSSSLSSSRSIIKEIAADISSIVDDSITSLVDKISKLPKKMGDGLKSSGKSLSDSLVSIWKDAVKASINPVNKVIEGANWIMQQFGSDKRVANWQPYAKGTDGHKGGNALVNDGRGAELVQMPNGKSFIPQGRNVFLPNAPKGMKVLPADRTAQLMGKKSPTFSYANGTGDFDIWSYLDDAKGLIGRVAEKFVSYDGVGGIALDISKGMVSTVTGQMTSWAKKLFDEMGAMGIGNYVASKGVEQWRATVIRALKMEGQYSDANVKRTLYQMQTESGGNPRAINLWDSNAKKGTPSKGLMQCIDPTFNAYARKGFDKNIYDPLSNILASIRYAVARYGSLGRAYRGVGYANGGIATRPSIFGEKGAEMAIPLSNNKRKRGLNLWAQTGDMLGVSLPSYSPESSGTSNNATTTEYNSYAPVFNLTLSGTSDDRTQARKVKRWIQEAFDDTFNSYASKNPKLREV